MRSFTRTSTTGSIEPASPPHRRPTRRRSARCLACSTSWSGGFRASATSSAETSPKPTGGYSRRSFASTRSTTATSNAPAPHRRLSQSLELPTRSLSAGRRRRDRQHGPHQAPLLRQPTPRESDRHRAAGAAARFFGAARPQQVRELGCAWRRIVAVSQTLRARQVEPSIHVDDHAIVAPRFLRGDKAVAHVVEDALWIARAWISDAAAPRQFEADRVAWRHGLPSFRPDG